MGAFAAAAARLTDAVKTRLGEVVLFAPKNGAEKSVYAVIQRDRDIVGSNGEISDRRMTATFAKADVGDETEGAMVTIGGSEKRVVDGIISDDGEMIEVALR